MSQVIIYEIEDNGAVAIVRPTAEVLASGRTIMQVAVKDVPEGRPFKVIDESELPANRSLRDAWRWLGDLSQEVNRDGIGGASNEFED